MGPGSLLPEVYHTATEVASEMSFTECDVGCIWETRKNSAGGLRLVMLYRRMCKHRVPLTFASSTTKEILEGAASIKVVVKQVIFAHTSPKSDHQDRT